TIQLFAEELYVSKNTIQKDLDEIKELLTSVNLELRVKRNSGITIEGNEFYIRQAIIINNNTRYLQKDYMQIPVYLDSRISARAYTYFKVCYPYMNINEVMNSVLQLEQLLEINFTDISIGRLMEYIAITVERIKKNHFIVTPHKEELKEIPVVYLQAAKKILLVLLLQSKFQNELEIRCLAARIYAAKVCKEEHISCEEVYIEEATQFVEKIGIVISNNSIINDMKLINDIGITLKKIDFNKSYDFINWDNLHLDIQERLAGLYGICMANLDEMEKKLHINFTSDEVARITMLVNNAIKRSNTKIKTVFVSGADNATAKYQAYKLEDEMSEICIIENIYYKQFDRKMYIDKLVISTVHLQNYDENYIEVTKHITPEDIEKINQKIKTIKSKKKINWNTGKTADVFCEELIVIDSSSREKGEIIKLASKLLYEKGYVEEGFKELVWKREVISSTYIGHGIAIPHVYGNGVKKSGVVIIRLKHSVLWNADKKVKLIFMLAINFKLKKEIRDFFKRFYLVISNEETISRLLEAKTSKEVLDILGEEPVYE
ncbi:MAG: PTS sugar transporter subunit IIA, partial [Lachnospiraceae bacterium]|nr:PTS sugar transporter subunit IIA [Lachnospiraceae bacterium]